MATHIKRLSDSPCSNTCNEMSEEVKISFQCLCCKINNDKNLENLVEFDTVEKLCAHLGAKYLVFVSSRSLKTRELSFAQFVYFLRKKCLFFNF